MTFGDEESQKNLSAVTHVAKGKMAIVVDRAKAAQLGLTPNDIMKSVIAATNNSSSNITKQDILNIPITGPNQPTPVPLKTVATIVDTQIPPFLILHVADHPETKMQSQRLVKVLQEAGISAKAYPAEGKNHTTINNDLGLSGDRPTQEMWEFLSKVLKK